MKRVLNIKGTAFEVRGRELTNTEVEVGYNENNNPMIVDFAKCDNLVIAGCTGTGKSKLVYNIINELVDKTCGDLLEIYAMQLVKTDFSRFSETEYFEEIIYPTSDEDTFTTLERMTSCIEHLARKVKRRSSIVRDMQIELGSCDKESIVTQLPLVIIVIDDFSAITKGTFNASENKLKEAFLESLAEILRLNKELNICLIQTIYDSKNLLKKENIYTNENI